MWGVGRKYRERLRRQGIATALDLAQKPLQWVADRFPQPIVNTYRELNGIDCIAMRSEGPSKSVSNTRTFPKMIERFEQLEAEVSNFAADCSATMRRQHTRGKAMLVFVETNHYRTDLPQYNNQAVCRIEPPTNVSAELVDYAVRLLRGIYRQGFRYKRAGVSITSVVSECDMQRSLWEEGAERRRRQQRLDAVADSLNSQVGRGTVVLGAQLRQQPDDGGK